AGPGQHGDDLGVEVHHPGRHRAQHGQGQEAGRRHGFSFVFAPPPCPGRAIALTPGRSSSLGTLPPATATIAARIFGRADRRLGCTRAKLAVTLLSLPTRMVSVTWRLSP